MSEIDDITQAENGFIENINYSIKPCVYFLLQDDEIVYIGKSDNGCSSRLSGHSKPDSVNSKWDSEDMSKRVSLESQERKVFNRVVYKEYTPPSINLLKKESEFIQKYIPKYCLDPVAMSERKKRKLRQKDIERFLLYNNIINSRLEYIEKDNQWKIVKDKVDFLIEDYEEKHEQF